MRASSQTRAGGGVEGGQPEECDAKEEIGDVGHGKPPQRADPHAKADKRAIRRRGAPDKEFVKMAIVEGFYRPAFGRRIDPVACGLQDAHASADDAPVIDAGFAPRIGRKIPSA